MMATGGKWDPAEGPIYFLAAGPGVLDVASRLAQCLLVAVNELDGRTALTRLDRWLADGRTVLLDSGVFNLATAHAKAHGLSMDEALGLAPEEIDGFDPLFDRYVELAARFGDRLWGYVELDQGGRENKARTRARLEAIGLRPIPVYHPFNDGWAHFDLLASSYDRLCFGNVVQAPAPARVELIHTMWARKQRWPGLWVHVLGYSVNELLHACPSNSADSSSWLQAIRWPNRFPLRSMGRLVDRLGGEFKHRVGADEGGPDGVTKATHFAASISQSEMMNWRQALERSAT